MAQARKKTKPGAKKRAAKHGEPPPQLDQGTFVISVGGVPVGWAWRYDAKESWIVQTSKRINRQNTPLSLDFTEHVPSTPHDTRAKFLAWVKTQCNDTKDYWHYYTDSLQGRAWNC